MAKIAEENNQTQSIIKEDARIVRTKRDLANALEELLKEKSFDEISIKEITDKALISKNTFYNNFEDKNDLLNFLFVRYEGDLIKVVKPILDKTFRTTRYFSYKKVIEIIVHFFYTTDLPIKEIIEHDSSKILLYSLNAFIQETFLKLEEKYKALITKTESQQLVRIFFSGAFASMIYFAYADNMQIPEKDLVKVVMKISLPVIE